ncbi:MAG: HPr family phosphocarrier protein [Eubacteriales bacterium]|nr:HPr family phosphocarrier protein [Eubacteriales bacterium]
MKTAQTTVKNSSGLHARPASDFVGTAKTFQSAITIRVASHPADTAVNAKSIIRLLSLGITAGTEVEISANGPDESKAVDALISLIDSGFGEE